MLLFSCISYLPFIGIVLADVSHRLDAGFGPNVAANQPLQLWCSTSPSSWDSCFYSTPDGHTYNLLPALPTVTDENGAPVPGVRANTSDLLACSIIVDQLPASQIGTWSCQLRVTQVPEFQVAFLNVITEPRVTDVRIPTDVVAQEYDVKLIPHIVVGDFTIEGEVSVRLDSGSAATNQIHLHSKDMVIYEDTVAVINDGNGLEITVAGFGYDTDRDFFILYFDDVLPQTTSFNVSMRFLGNLNDDLSGFYRSSYEENGVTHYLAITQFQATDARKAFPCMDEPSLKAVFNVMLGRSAQYSSASNMPIASANVPVPGNPEYVYDIYEPTPRMSTYLVAFLVSEFRYREGDLLPNNVPFRIWSKPDLFDLTEYAASIGPQILQHYEGLFNIPFPLPKQDMGAIPDLSFGGMENWGLITYRESRLLYEEGVTSLQDQDILVEVVAHELAHMWFGDLVTMGWWSDLWLNEGFATYVSYIGGDFVEPSFHKLDRSVLDTFQSAFSLDALDSSHPVQAEVNHPDEINEIFDQISYDKGSSLVSMMVNFLGSSTFQKGITSYLNAFQYSNAYTEDLLDKLTEAALEDGALDNGLTVSVIMDNWIKLKGFPVVSVTKPDPVGSPKTLTMNQERFLLGDSDTNDPNVYQWYVPISYTYAGGNFSDTKNQEWLYPSTELTLDLPSEFPSDKPYIFNIKSTGYYRVNYDIENWLSVADNLRQAPNSIDLVNRAQILDDSLNLARQGSLDYDTSLEQTLYLNIEDEYVPWKSASNAFDYIQLMFQRSPDYSAFSGYLSQQLDPLYIQLGYNSKPQDTFNDVLLRELTLGYLCGFGYADCVNRATQDFSTWMNSPNPDLGSSNPIDPSIRGTVYCTSIAEGDSNTWDFLFQRYVNGLNPNERTTILYSLGCSTDPTTLQTYLDMTLDPQSDLRKQDAGIVVSGVSGNPIGTTYSWDWLRTNWDQIISYFDTSVSSPVGDMVTSVTRSFNTQQELQELNQFYSDNINNLGSAERATESAIRTTEANVAWMGSYYDIVATWLSSHN